MSEFGVRKSLLMEKFGEWGGLRVSTNSSWESSEFRLLLCQREGGWAGQEASDYQRHLDTSRIQEELRISKSRFLLHWPLLIWVWSWGSRKSLINKHYFIYISSPPRESRPWQGAILVKTQASDRISLIISISVAGAICLKAMGETLARIKTESERVSISLLHQLLWFSEHPMRLLTSVSVYRLTLCS